MPVADRRVGAFGSGAAPAVEWGLLCNLDSRWYLTALGEGWEDMLGWTREELFSRPFVDFVHPTEREGTLAALAAAWQGDSAAAIALDTRFRVRGGRWQRVRWSPSPDRAEVLAAGASAPARTAWRDYPIIGAALRAFVVVALICAAIGVVFVLTSFAPQDGANPPLPVTDRVPAGMDGPVTGSGPTLSASNGTTPPPGLVGAPLER